MEELLALLDRHSTMKEILLSVVVLLLFLLTKVFVNRSIKKNRDIKRHEKLVIKKKFGLYSNIFFVLMLLILWFNQLQVIFVSLFAVAAAFVLATKELIMCFTGGVLVSLNKHFKNGDRIEIDGLRGYVVEKTFTTTKILEIGPEKNSQQTTGHIITLPNSIFLTKSLKNESYFQGYSINSFIFKVEEGLELEELEKFLLRKANNIVMEYLDSAKKYISKFCEREGFDIPSIEPRIKVVVDEDNDVLLLLKMPVKNSDIASVEQDLLRSYVGLMKR